jgi:hypothetical protein
MESERAGSAYTKEHTGLTVDERISFLFQPDTLLPAQYFENFRRKTFLEPEKRLMLAILEDAVASFQDNLLAQSVKNQRLFQDTEEWITEAAGDWVFSFESVCETLGINPEYVRRGLLRWKQKRLPKDADTKVGERKKLAG